ncbi:MAG: DAHL domain-containing protein, partial [Motiliproteus sp.]
MSHLPEKIEVDLSSRHLFVRGGVIITIALLLLTLMYLKAEAVSPQAHIGYTQQLRLLREADAKVDSEMLAARLEISRNYDALTSYVNEMKEAAQALLNPPTFLRLANSVQIEKVAAELQKVLQHKADLIDRFKSYNAIVRNSLAYFQESASRLSGVPDPLNNQLENYVRQALFFARDPDPQSAYRLHFIRLKIESEALPSEYQTLVGTLFLHGSVVEEYLLSIDQLTRTILGLANVSKQATLLTSYLITHNLQPASKASLASA